jgi:hypothetical protein
MKIEDVPTSELRRILDATSKALGSDVAEVRILQRELARREAAPLNPRASKGEAD